MNPSDPNYLRFYYDYLYGLDFRGRSKAVIENSTQLNIPLENYRHMYVMQLLIVIWRSKTEKAEFAYKTLLTEKNYPDMTVYTGLYYSYIEQENIRKLNNFSLKLIGLFNL